MKITIAILIVVALLSFKETTALHVLYFEMIPEGKKKLQMFTPIAETSKPCRFTDLDEKIHHINVYCPFEIKNLWYISQDERFTLLHNGLSFKIGGQLKMDKSEDRIILKSEKIDFRVTLQEDDVNEFSEKFQKPRRLLRKHHK